MKISKLAMAAAMAMLVAGVYAYVPENTEENSYQERVEGPFIEVSTLIDDGIKAVNQNVVSSTYENSRGTHLGHNGLAEGEAGKEEVTSTDALSYQPKEEIYEAKENLEEIIIWIDHVPDVESRRYGDVLENERVCQGKTKIPGQVDRRFKI